MGNVEPGFLELFIQGPFGWLAAGLWGLVWGSFFNVLIVRVPGRESPVNPASHCRSCKAPIPWYDNIPVISYLVLRGRCRACGARFSARYLLVELLVATLTLTMYYAVIVSDPQLATPVGLRLARFVIVSLFVGLLVAITFIDLATMRIPDVITYPAIPLCMGLSLFMGHTHWWDGPVGGVGGYLLIRLVADGYRLVTGRTGMGYGDAKLLAMIGGLMGWQVLLPVLFLSALQGTVIGVSLLVIVRAIRKPTDEADQHESRAENDANEDETDDEDADEEVVSPGSLRYAKLPFGPFISLAAVEVLLLGDLLRVFFPYFYI
jgi:leader peptidase (prepilin peptidase)/N-methyltransferase